jgi:uncharacterized protein (DUF2062 family)
VNWARPAHSFWKKNIAHRLASLSIEEVTAETIALSVALGLVFGIFPMYGCPTLLCAAAAVLLRLNLPALQLVNYLSSPLQVALLAPFNQLGQRLLRDPGTAPAPHVAGLFHADIWRLLSSLSTAAMHAIAGWLCVCVPLGILVYLTLAYLVRQYRSEKCFNGTRLDAPLNDAI